MADCIYCGNHVEGHPEHCPDCGQAEPVPENVEPAHKSPFSLRYSSCCRTRLKLAMMFVGMISVSAYLLAYWLPAGAGPLQMAALIIPGLFAGAILGVYGTMTLAFFYAAISSGETVSASKT